MRTTPLVSFGLFAQSIKDDATLSFNGPLQPFSKLDDLLTGNVSSNPYITYEPDFWLLDGNYKFKPVNNSVVHVGLVSLEMSDGSGLFIPPYLKLTATFGTTHDTDGISLRFFQASDDYSVNAEFTYYDNTDAIIRVDAYAISSWEFSTNQSVAGIKKIDIRFALTNKAYRYLHLTGIDFGKLTYFTGADIKSCTVVEETNPLSIELPIDTCELNLFSSDAAFSIINPAGDYSALQEKQPLDVYELVGNDQLYIGKFFLNTWENVSNNEIKFKCIDTIGILETIPYLGGMWFGGDIAIEIIDSILSAINIPYDLDLSLYDAEIVGWIPVTTTREALQQIAFAIGAFVSCSRSGILKIFPSVLASDLSSFDYTVTKAEKGLSQSLTLKTLVTGVEVTAHNYTQNITSTDLYNGYLAAGDHTITFNSPAHDLVVSGATITASGANYAILNVAIAGTVVLSGQGYEDTKRVTAINTPALDPNTKQNILSINDATLVNSSNVATLTQRVYDYYQQRYLQKVKLYASEIAVTNSVVVDTLYGRQMGGIVEKSTLNLSGGFTSQTEIVGVVIE